MWYPLFLNPSVNEICFEPIDGGWGIVFSKHSYATWPVYLFVWTAYVLALIGLWLMVRNRVEFLLIGSFLTLVVAWISCERRIRLHPQERQFLIQYRVFSFLPTITRSVSLCDQTRIVVLPIYGEAPCWGIFAVNTRGRIGLLYLPDTDREPEVKSFCASLEKLVEDATHGSRTMA